MQSRRPLEDHLILLAGVYFEAHKFAGPVFPVVAHEVIVYHRKQWGIAAGDLKEHNDARWDPG